MALMNYDFHLVIEIPAGFRHFVSASAAGGLTRVPESNLRDAHGSVRPFFEGGTCHNS